MASRKVFYAILGLLGLTLGCSKSGHDRDLMLFYGECHVEVESKTSGAEIMLDGILIGHGKASANVPCGEKEVYVKKEGYLPFQEYLPVSSNQPLAVKVELRKLKKRPEYALSGELIKQVKDGKPLSDPWEMKFKRAGMVAAASSESSLATPTAVSAPASGAAPTAGAPAKPSANAAETEEDWR